MLHFESPCWRRTRSTQVVQWTLTCGLLESEPNSEYFFLLGAHHLEKIFPYSSLTWGQDTLNGAMLDFTANMPARNADFFAVTHLFRKQTVEDKHHHSLKAARDGEQVRHYHCPVVKLETAKYPRDTENTQLGHCSNGECPADGNRDTKKTNKKPLTWVLGENINHVLFAFRNRQCSA